ncbi:MAG TPA: hypothetical protein VGE82_02455 [Nitrososphaera sp.]|jgi:hypothetical protein
MRAWKNLDTGGHLCIFCKRGNKSIPKRLRENLCGIAGSIIMITMISAKYHYMHAIHVIKESIPMPGVERDYTDKRS